jgi:hypothetical protein
MKRHFAALVSAAVLCLGVAIAGDAFAHQGRVSSLCENQGGVISTLRAG